MMYKIIKIFSPLIVFPLLFNFIISSKKNYILEDLYARKKFSNNKLQQLFDLSFELLTNSYFRTLFYFRNPNLFSILLRNFYKKHPSFIIEVNTKIGKGLQLAHPYATILNAESIGDYVYVNHLVTVGEKNGKKPIIGNQVQIHAHSIIIGGITIGNKSIIGAGSVVVKDVPEGAVVAGNPAKIIRS